jgi:hypothetical protein
MYQSSIRNRGAIVRVGLIEERDFNERLAAPSQACSQKLRAGVGKGWTMSAAFSSLAYYYTKSLKA